MYLEDYLELTYLISAIFLIVLKLFGVVKFSWWWVTAPFWAPIAFVTLILLTGAIVYWIPGVINKLINRRKK